MERRSVRKITGAHCGSAGFVKPLISHSKALNPYREFFPAAREKNPERRDRIAFAKPALPQQS
jgi:hypothetical protein